MDRRMLLNTDRARARSCQPNRIAAGDRLDEVARLLALGYLRLRARRQAAKPNEPNQLREFGLDFRGEGSVCDTDANAQRRRP
jgi:hypothetical protein